jgi:membrane-bound lytic murein transglycosylase D
MIRTFLRALLLPAAAAAFVTPPAAAGDDPFPCPGPLQPGVSFWKDVFLRYDEDQIVFFDDHDWERVYEVHRIPTPDGTRARERDRERSRAAIKERIIEDLEALAAPDVEYDSLIGRLYRLHMVWDGTRDPEVYAAAAERVRSQRGIRTGFLDGVARSTRFHDVFRRIFREEGVPEDLVYLPHIESSYRWNARSGVGAVGMWQFMASTGKRYLRIDDAVDERLDPYEAARAAARHFRQAYETVGTWPLTITGYNQGMSSMVDAQRVLGTDDIVRVIREYRGPVFKFAGRNFYVEFLAARKAVEEILETNHGLELHEPVEFESFELPAYVKLSRFAETFGVERGTLRDLNLGMRAPVVRDTEWLPKGYAVKLPPGLAGDAHGRFASIPEAERPLVRPVRSYRVRNGDNLSGIARRFKTSVRALQELNRIHDANHVRIGQLLRLPG